MAKTNQTAQNFPHVAEDSSTTRFRNRGGWMKWRIRGESQDDGEGNWLVAYADMMTLLLGFFVILAAFSTPDAEKFEKLKQATAEKLKVTYTKPYEEIAEILRNVLKDFNLDKDVVIDQTAEGLILISKGTLFFDSGSSILKPQASQLVEKIADILAAKARAFRIVVEGHTDDVPIESRLFPSNWELSSSRASTVIRLLEAKGFNRTQLRPVGLSDSQPIVPNRDEAGTPITTNQAQNRRIVIRIQRQLPPRVDKVYDPLKPSTEF